jgi:hypothetical protein
MVCGAPLSALLSFIVRNQSNPQEFLTEYRGHYAWGPRSCARYFKTESEAQDAAQKFGGQVEERWFKATDYR